MYEREIWIAEASKPIEKKKGVFKFQLNWELRIEKNIWVWGNLMRFVRINSPPCDTCKVIGRTGRNFFSWNLFWLKIPFSLPYGGIINHGIIEAGKGGVQQFPSAAEATAAPCPRVPPPHFKLAFKSLQGGDSTLCQGWSALSMKEFSWNPPWHSLRPFPPILSCSLGS